MYSRGLGFGVWGLGFRGFGVQGFGFRGLGFRVTPKIRNILLNPKP